MDTPIYPAVAMNCDAKCLISSGIFERGSAPSKETSYPILTISIQYLTRNPPVMILFQQNPESGKHQELKESIGKTHLATLTYQ